MTDANCQLNKTKQLIHFTGDIVTVWIHSQPSELLTSWRHIVEF